MCSTEFGYSRTCIYEGEDPPAEKGRRHTERSQLLLKAVPSEVHVQESHDLLGLHTEVSLLLSESHLSSTGGFSRPFEGVPEIVQETTVGVSRL